MTITTNKNNQQVFKLMIMGDINIKILRSQLLFLNSISNIIPSPSFSKHVEQKMDNGIREYIPRIWLLKMS